MAESQWPFLAAVLLLVSRGLQCSPVLPTCPGPCPCQRGPLLNCSSSGLSTAPGHIRATVAELDLSHNLLTSLTLRRPNQNLQNLWLGSNRITHLSLCTGRTATSQDVQRAGPHPSRTRSRQGCLSWAPALQLLSVERNQLVQLPEGLGGSGSLRVLQLSYNRISTLRPGDLSSLLQLRELHLQHNHLTGLHPQAFRDLSQLRVLNLSFNLLTTLPPSTYLSLRNLGAEVDLCGNRWQCDCSMRSARRWMLYDRDRGRPAWRVVCDSPSAVSGRDLLQLEEGDLTCTAADNGPGLHQDATVDEGSDILLQCSSTHKDSTWWTPNGQVSVNQPEAGLLIRDITERDTGLYVCMSESQQELVSVFNLQIWKTGETQRKTRSSRSSPWESQLVIPLQGILLDRMAQVRNNTTDDLALAVSLSVIFTFLIAFILGVLARPLIDILCRRICTKKTSSATYSVSSAGQRPYDNDGYSDGEEPEEIGAHRERRVTFTTEDFREYTQASNSNVPYYDTVASVNQESIHEGAVKESGATYVDVQEGCSSLSSSAVEPEKKNPKAGDSDSDSSSQHDSPKEHQRGQKDLPDITHPGTTHSMEFEHIPDPEDLEERRSSSSHSETSHSDREKNEEQMAQKNLPKPQSTQKVEDTSQLRSQSPTVRPVEVPQISIDSGSEIPGFTSEPFADWPPNKNESEIWNESGESFEFSDSFQGTSARSSSVLGSLAHSEQNAFPPSDSWKRPDSTSSSSTLSGDELTHYTVNPESEEDEDIEASQNTQFTHDTKPEIVNPYLTQDVSFEQQMPSEDPFKPPIREEGFNQSCSDSRQETQTPPMGSGHSNSSTSSDSDDEPTEYAVNEDSDEEKEEEEKVRASDKSTSVMVTIEGDRAEEISPAPWTDIEPKAQQPDLTLGVPSIKKKRKAPLPPANAPAAVSSSSSSESDAETTDHTVKQNWDGAKAGITSQEPETNWPDLGPQSIPKIKTHLDIKAPSPPPPNTSSSSSSEDETTDHKVERGGEEAKVPEITYRQPPNSPAPLPPRTAVRIKSDSSASSADEREERAGKDLSSTSTKVGPEPGSKWPDLGLISVPRIKRHLDIKAPSAESSSSSSESDDENKDRTVKQEGEVVMVKTPLIGSLTPKTAQDIKLESYASITNERESTWAENISPAPKENQEARWAGLGLSISRFKKRLDITSPKDGSPKVPTIPPPKSSSSSSESEDEKKDGIRRRLDIKIPEEAQPAVPAPLPPDSSSSSESEDETSRSKGFGERAEVPGFPVTEPKPHPGSMWTGVPSIKRRLDIKIAEEAPPAMPAPHPPGSSSSSESEDETSRSKGFVEVGEVPGFPMTEPKPHPGSMWTGVPSIKRRLDIKIAEEAPPAMPAPHPPGSSSSSESEDETSRSKGFVEVGDVPGFPMTEPKPHPGSMWTGVPSIKRCLDIKIAEEAPPAMPAPHPPGSSSSSESEDETSRSKGFVEVGEVPGFPMTEPKPHPGSMWTGVPSIKRRLDIKIAEEAPPAMPAPHPPGSSSSSESEDETSGHTGKGFVEGGEVPGFPTTEVKTDPWSMWASLGVPLIKRRLDIKIPEEAPPAVPSPRPLDSSSSSESEDETSGLRERAEVPVIMYKESPQSSDSLYSSSRVEREPASKWPDLGSSRVPRIKKRLDIKAPSPPQIKSSSSSDSEDETTGQTVRQEKDRTDVSFASQEPETKWPALDLQNIPHIKRRLDIKAPSPPPSPPPPADSSSSSSESEDETSRSKGFGERAEEPGFPVTEPKPHPGSMWTGVPSIKRRLDIKIAEEAPPAMPAPLPPDSSSSSESEDETSGHTGKGFVEGGEVPGFPTTEVKTDPWSMWASLGVPLIKRRLDIKIPEEAPPAVPSPRPLDSSSSSESEDETSGLRERAEVPVIMHKESPQSSDSLYSSSRVEREPASKWPDLGSSRVPRIKKRLDIKAPSPPQIKSSSSSDSEDKTTGQTVRQEKDRTDVSFASQEPETKWPALDLQNIPHIKRRLDIKAPSPPPSPPPPPPPADSSSSSSSSEDETKDHTVKQGKGESEKFIVTGKDPSLSVGGINVSLAPRRALNISFDDVVRGRLEQNRRTPDVDLAPELQWKGIGRYSQSAISISQESRTALSTSSLRRQVDVDIKPTQEAPPTVPGGPPPPATSSSSSSSSSESGDENYSSISPGSVSLAPRGALDIKFANSSTSTDVTDWRARSEARRERRGLTALKAMSSERQTWDPAQGEQQTGSYSVRQDQSISYRTSTTFKYESSEKDRTSLAKMSAPESPISTLPADETRAVGSPHRISRLRRRAVVAFQPPQETPPPVPGAAPPVEEKAAAGSTWSPQSSVRQDWSSMGSYQQREMSVDGYVFSSVSSKSKTDEGQMSPSFIGLTGATPYHPHTAPKRYQRVTSSTRTLRIDREESNTSSTVSENHSVFDYSNSISEV